MSFFGDLITRLQQDPALANAMVQFGSAVTQPMDPRQSSLGHFGQALAQSAEYLRKQREMEQRQKLAERQVGADELRASAAKEEAETRKEEQRFGERQYEEVGRKHTEEKTKLLTEEQDLARARAEEARARARREKYLMDLAKGNGMKFDKGLWDAVAGHLEFLKTEGLFQPKDDTEYGNRFIQEYNRVARAFNYPPLAPPLDRVPDENIINVMKRPETLNLFLQRYGDEGRVRVDAIQRKLLEQQFQNTQAGKSTTTPRSPRGETPRPPVGAGVGPMDIVKDFSSWKAKRAMSPIVEAIAAGREPTETEIQAARRRMKATGLSAEDVPNEFRKYLGE